MVEELRVGNIAYRKGEVETPLEARIERIFYINTYGQVSGTNKLDLFPVERLAGDLPLSESGISRDVVAAGHPGVFVWIPVDQHSSVSVLARSSHCHRHFTLFESQSPPT